MKTPFTSIAIAATVALAALASALPAQAATDYLLKLDGIKGETRLDATLTRFEWPTALASGSFVPGPMARAGGVFVASGDVDGDGLWDAVTLRALQAGAGDAPFFEFRYIGVDTTSSSAAGGSHKEWINLESVMPPMMLYRPLLATGGRGAPISGTWDTSGRFVGDPSVFDAFAELGAERWADGTVFITTSVPEPGTWTMALLGAAVAGLRLRRQAQAA